MCFRRRTPLTIVVEQLPECDGSIPLPPACLIDIVAQGRNRL
jgi:hypothetical protein